jgi:hypothetical protein
MALTRIDEPPRPSMQPLPQDSATTGRPSAQEGLYAPCTLFGSAVEFAAMRARPGPSRRLYCVITIDDVLVIFTVCLFRKGIFSGYA